MDSRLAQAWRKSTPKVRAKYERKITEMLREMKETEFYNLLILDPSRRIRILRAKDFLEN